MQKLKLLAAALAWLLPAVALAQTSPNLKQGQVLTPAQWNQLFINKQDALGYVPMNAAGGTFTGRVVTAPPGASTAGLNLTPGSAPASPASGDMWITSGGLFARIGGTTIGPLAAASSTSFAATAPIVVSFPAGVATYGLNTGVGLFTGGGNLNLRAAAALEIGGVNSVAPVSHQWINSISTSGVPSLSQPGYPDIAPSGTSGLGLVSNGGSVAASFQALSLASSTFLAAGTGAVSRTGQAKLRDIVAVTDYGALGNNSLDNSSLFQNAITETAVAGGTVVVPAGTYRSCSTVHLASNVGFVGVGESGVSIVPCANNQVVFDKIDGAAPTFPDAVQLSNLTIDSLAFTGVTGVKAVFATGLVVSDVTFKGTSINFDIDRGRGFKCLNCTATGNAVQAAGMAKLWSSDDGDYLLNPLISNYTIYDPGNGLQSAQAFYMRRVLTSIVSNVHNNSLGGKIGIVIENDSQGAIFSNVLFANISSAVVQQNGAGPVIGPSFTTYTNVSPDQPSDHAFQILNGNWTTIDGGNVTANPVAFRNKDCIFLGAGTDVSISHVTCQGFDASGGTFVEIGAGMDKVRIDNNKVTSVDTALRFIGTPTNVRVHGNTFSSVVSLTIGNSAGAGNFIWDNGGFPDQLFVANGGTGLSFGTSGGVPYFSAAQAMQSSGVLAQFGLVYGGGAGGAPATTAAGTDGQILLGKTGLAPAFGTVSGDAIISNAGTVTLATVNSNVGTFGDATHASQVTVNGKGQVTAASSVLITGSAPGGAAGGDLSGSYPNPLVANLTTGVTVAGTMLHSNIAAPSTPASAKNITWTDSTDLRFHDKNASGVIGTTVVADTGASNQFLTAISAAGAISKAQPSFSNLSGSLACSQTPALTGDVTTSAGACPTTLATAQPAVHTWALAQTFTVAPVFTDQSGSRTALGLGSIATQSAASAAITGGTIAGLTGLAIRDTSAAFDVTIAATSAAALSAGRTLTLNMGNVAHTLAFGTTANTITFPNLASYTLITNGDTASVTNAMLAGSIAASKLIGSDIATVGTLTGGATGAGFTVALGTSTIAGQLTGTNGGTGVNNGSNTITIAGNVTHAGAFAQTITATAISNSTLPPGTHTLAGLDVAQTWSAVQQFNSGDLKLAGATSGLLTVNCAATCGTNTLTFPAGTTDFSATGGTSQVLKQTSAGGAITVAQLAFTDISGTIATGQVSGSYTGITGVGPLTAGSVNWSGSIATSIATNGAINVGGGTAQASAHFANSVSTNYSAIAIENTSTGGTLTKSVSLDFYGRDTVSTQKLVGRIRVQPNDSNWAGGGASGMVFSPETANASVTDTLTLAGNGSAIFNNAAVATNATDGFIYIATSAGTPTGVPTAYTGRVALVYDTTNHQFWIYDGGWKQPKTPSAAALVTWQ